MDFATLHGCGATITAIPFTFFVVVAVVAVVVSLVIGLATRGLVLWVEARALVGFLVAISHIEFATLHSCDTAVTAIPFTLFVVVGVVAVLVSLQVGLCALRLVLWVEARALVGF